MLLTQYYSDYKIEDGAMSGACSMHGRGGDLHSGIRARTKGRDHLQGLNEDGQEDVNWIYPARDMTTGGIL